MTLPWTIAWVVASLALAGFAAWHERRPRELGQVSLVPTTLLLGLGVVLFVVGAAHLLTLTTGVALPGRAGLP